MTATIPDDVTEVPAKTFREVNRDAIRLQLRIDAANAAMTGTGFVLERRRGNRIKHQAGARLAELEKALDPGRTSSTDSPDGSQPDGNNDE